MRSIRRHHPSSVVVLISRRLLVVAALLLGSSSAFADWVKLTVANGTGIYFEPALLQRTNQLARTWTLADFPDPQTGQGGRRYLSTRRHEEYNCATAQFRLIAKISYASHLATGAVVDTGGEKPNEWLAISADSPHALILDKACHLPAHPAVPPRY
jgi:hypothetical protein